ncbi:MAG TPA: mandelate racemase/muconate lactonizing enzyme family protein [Solirubrobacterales bacterium]|nr:mandelate racemase/muconate lactonizing enzyme family protein [Solirubrobacterales bacterium]
MRLASVEVIPYALPFREPYVTARGTLRQREMVLLRVRDGDGVVGLGEAVPLALRGGVGLAEVVRELEEWAEHREAEGLSAPARCAVATARMDLLGRRVGGKEAGKGEGDEAVPCNATLVAGPPEEVAAQAEHWARDGFTTFKLKLGAETATESDIRTPLRSRGAQDVEQVRAVRSALGPGVRIRVDVNGAWDLETAKWMLADLEPLGIELAEQPVATLGEMAELAASTSIPLAADESVATLDEAEEAVAKGACAYTGIKLSKVGGPETALAIADVLPAYVTSALDGPVGIAAAAQVALSLTETQHPERLALHHGLATQRLFASTIASVECEVRDGRLNLPPGPGLGIEIDEEALEAHRL